MELPLCGHDLGVSTGDLNARVETGTVVSFDYITAVDVVVTNGTVVWALWAGITLLWPAVWVSLSTY